MTEIRPLDLCAVDLLGPRASRCVFWQTDGPMPSGEGTPGPALSPGDPEFEKEAWISSVSLQWGLCGQVALMGDDTVGAAFYAPPGMVPRAAWFPTWPVAADAILLAGITEEKRSPAGVTTSLLDAVVTDLRSRGIKAIEAFGAVGRDHDEATSRDMCGSMSCVSSVALLIEHGFSVVADHEKYPRLRLEIESDLLWKADVERALDQLVAEHGLATKNIGSLSGATALSRTH